MAKSCHFGPWWSMNRWTDFENNKDNFKIVKIEGSQLNFLYLKI